MFLKWRHEFVGTCKVFLFWCSPCHNKARILHTYIQYTCMHTYSDGWWHTYIYGAQWHERKTQPRMSKHLYGKSGCVRADTYAFTTTQHIIRTISSSSSLWVIECFVLWNEHTHTHTRKLSIRYTQRERVMGRIEYIYIHIRRFMVMRITDEGENYWTLFSKNDSQLRDGRKNYFNCLSHFTFHLTFNKNKKKSTFWPWFVFISHSPHTYQWNIE